MPVNAARYVGQLVASRIRALRRTRESYANVRDTLDSACPVGSAYVTTTR